jgi:PAS domain S-box-containing protein
MAGICMDVTKRKLAEEKFRLVVEASPSAVVMVDQHGRIALVNTQTERMFGYHRDELIGQSVEVLVPQRFRDNHPMYRAGFLQQPRVRSMGAGRDLFAVRKDGSEFPVEIGLNPIESSEGLFVLSAILDISERKRAEQALKNTNEELEQKNREMEQFVYTVSHDLKSPLVTMMGFVGLLLEDLKAGRHEETIESAERIQRGAQRMSEMINDLLQLSRVGRVQNELEWVDVTALVHEIGADLAERMGEAGVVLRIQEEMPRVMADRTRLGEVFENLLTNAIKYAASGDAPQIVVGSVTMPGQIRFFVRDNGPGIEPKYHNRIFGLFQRLNTNQEGTGMGLTIVARIMQAHGGRCWVESTLGTGATFWLALPA